MQERMEVKFHTILASVLDGGLSLHDYPVQKEKVS
jgi:hypothetical protein